MAFLVLSFPPQAERFFLKLFYLTGGKDCIVIKLNFGILLNPIRQGAVRYAVFLMNLGVGLARVVEINDCLLKFVCVFAAFFPDIFMPPLTVFHYIILVHFLV